MKEKLDALKTLLSPLTTFFSGSMLATCAFGLLSSILSLRLNASGISTYFSGIVMALYYVGYIFAATRAHKMINKIGHIRSFGVYISVVSSLVLMHSFLANPSFWGLLRFLEGYCVGGCTMCLESWLNTRAHNKNRGLIMSLYMVTSYLGAGLGQLMLNIPDQNGMVIYIIISILFSLAFLPISLTALPAPEINFHKSLSIATLYKKSPVGIVGLVCSGLMVGSFYALGPIYTQKAGFSLTETSLFMFFGILGGLSAQIPVGRLSDKMDRRLVMMGSCALLFFIAPSIHILMSSGIVLLAMGAFFLGTCTFVLYPICVSHINDLIDDSERVKTSGILILMQGIGLICGPIIVSFFMDKFGDISFVSASSIIAGSFFFYTLRQIKIKPDINYTSVTPTDPIPMAPTAAFNELSTKDTMVDLIKKRVARKGLQKGI